jgi:hypothetical protein
MGGGRRNAPGRPEGENYRFLPPSRRRKRSAIFSGSRSRRKSVYSTRSSLPMARTVRRRPSRGVLNSAIGRFVSVGLGVSLIVPNPPRIYAQNADRMSFVPTAKIPEPLRGVVWAQKSDDAASYAAGNHDSQPTVEPVPEKRPRLQCSITTPHFDLRDVAEPVTPIFINTLPWRSYSSW